MNLQLFGYDDGYYYGQCKLVFEIESTRDNGKTVTITDGTTTKSGTLRDKKCEILVPGRSSWTVTLLDGATAMWTGKVDCGYGECIRVMLADGYKPILEKSVMNLNDIKSATDLNGKLPSAKALKDAVTNVDNKLGGIQFRINNGKAEWKGSGADTWIPFKRGIVHRVRIAGSQSGATGSYSDPPEKTGSWTVNVASFIANNHLNINYKELTNENFGFIYTGSDASVFNSGIEGRHISWGGVSHSYNPSNGVLSVSNHYYNSDYGVTFGRTNLETWLYYAE